VTVYTVPLPWTSPPLNLNDRDHWSVHHEKISAARETAGWAVKTAGVPKLQRVLVALHYRPAVNRTRDSDNLVATLKPVCDGIVDAGVVKDDAPQYMVKLMPIIHAPEKPGAVWLTIESLPDSPAGDGVQSLAGDPSSPPRDPRAETGSVGSQPRGGEHQTDYVAEVAHLFVEKRQLLHAAGLSGGMDIDAAAEAIGVLHSAYAELINEQNPLCEGSLAQQRDHWRRIAVKLARVNADWIRLSIPEADALRAAIADAEAIEVDAEDERTADAATYHQEDPHG